MDLYKRLFPTNPDVQNIAVHLFRAALGDYATGNLTQQDMVDFWALDDESETHLNKICDLIDSKVWLEKVAFFVDFENVLILAEGKVKYLNSSDFAERIGL